MCPSRSKAIHLPSGDRLNAIHVPSLVSKSMSRVCPRAFVVSHSAEGFDRGLLACFTHRVALEVFSYAEKMALRPVVIRSSVFCAHAKRRATEFWKGCRAVPRHD